VADLRHFFMNVVGESFRNDDGTSRQKIIPRCRVGELLRLEHEPDNPHDSNAIRVLRRDGGQIGYLPRDFAAEVVSRRAKGLNYHAVVAGVGRARGGRRLYGVSLLVVVEDVGAAADVIRAYAARVLADDDRGMPLATAPPRRARHDDVPREQAIIWLLGALAVGFAVAWAVLFR
jgi:hypothetical protein